MSGVLVATASVHTTPAACDYLEDRLGSGDTVVGQRRGDPETAGTAPGSTVRTLLAEAASPVVVVPV